MFQKIEYGDHLFCFHQTRRYGNYDGIAIDSKTDNEGTKPIFFCICPYR